MPTKHITRKNRNRLWFKNINKSRVVKQRAMVTLSHESESWTLRKIVSSGKTLGLILLVFKRFNVRDECSIHQYLQSFLIFCEICGFHGGEDRTHCSLGCCFVQCGGCTTTFRRAAVSTFRTSSKVLVTYRITTLHNSPENNEFYLSLALHSTHLTKLNPIRYNLKNA